VNKNLINKNNSREWVKCNDDAKAARNRENFINEHGGVFIRNGRYWRWKEEIIKKDGNDNSKKEYIFINKDGIEFIVNNFSKFCRQNDLNKGAMFKVLSGARGHHKGFTVKRL
jgi:hypothetical protein